MKNRLLILVMLFGLAGIIVISGCNSTDRSKPQTTINGLIPAEIPDSENGALVYREAFKIRDSLSEKYTRALQYIENPAKFNKASLEDKTKFADIILNDPDFAKFYHLLEKASQMKCQFLKRKDYTEGIALVTTSHLMPIKSCAGILSTKSRIEAGAGMSDKALATCLTALRMAGSTSTEPYLISQLVRMASDVTTLDSIDEVINKGGVNPELYASIIKEIDSERKCDKAQFALEGERVIVVNWLEQIVDKLEQDEKMGVKSSEAGVLYSKEVISNFASEKEIKKTEELIRANPKKFYVDQIASYRQIMSEAIAIFKEPYSKAITDFRSLDEKIKNLPENVALAKMLITPFSRLYVHEKKVNAYLGAAELGLANRLYKNKYGNFAGSLDQLVPGFLPSLPLDPFTGKSYIYKKKDKGFIIYSLAENLKDDGGEYQGIKSSENYDIAWIDK